MTLKITLVGSHYFAQDALAALVSEPKVVVLRAIAPEDSDHLAVAARNQSLDLALQTDACAVGEELIPSETDLIVAARTPAILSPEALDKAKLGGVGYHPSLLPRHRGLGALDWTIRAGDAIAGGTVFHLTEAIDAGPIAVQDWCFVKKGETASDLWDRALRPMGVRLILETVRGAIKTGLIAARPQEEAFATDAPPIR